MMACSLLLVGIIGCATTAPTTKSTLLTIDSETIQTVIEDESRKLPIEPGDLIGIGTTKRISMSSRNVFYVEMVVKEVNTTTIRGEVDSEPEKEGITGDIVEVKLEDINRISYIGEKEQTVGDKGGGFPARLVLLPVDIALTEIGLVVFITLLMLIL
jgi:hypothetical protein